MGAGRFPLHDGDGPRAREHRGRVLTFLVASEDDGRLHHGGVGATVSAIVTLQGKKDLYNNMLAHGTVTKDDDVGLHE